MKTENVPVQWSIKGQAAADRYARAHKSNMNLADLLDVVDHIIAAVAPQIARAALERAAGVARNGCLVPPDGGSPTEAEADMCDHIADAILALPDE